MNRFKTNPHHQLDGIFWTVLKIFWEPLSLKRSHWWHWINLPPEKLGNNFPFVVSNGCQTAKSREGFWPNFWQTNFGWKTAVIITPRTNGEYLIGFMDENGRTQICSIIMNGHIALLEGPTKTKFFAISVNDNKPIKLKIVVKNVPKKQIKKYGLFLF